MKIQLPVLHEEIVLDELVQTETLETFDLDTSVYSEERWEKHFPQMAEKEGLFAYIERVSKTKTTDRVRVISMLKAVFCFIESEKVSTYKEFAQMFSLSSTEYTNRLIDTLKKAFETVLRGSAVKN